MVPNTRKFLAGSPASPVSFSSLKVAAIVLAAGSGQRMGGREKLFVRLGKDPLLAHSVAPFQDSKVIDYLVLVFNDKNLKRGQELVKRMRWSKVLHICLGGKRRQDSVAEGLKKLKGCKWVFIHDGARPFIDQEMIQRGFDAAQETGAAVAAVQVKETIKIAQSGVVRETLPRQNLWIAQTPQVFRFDMISSAYEQVKDDVTDDAMLVEKIGYRVKLYPGSYDNIKITTPQDLQLAKEILRCRVRASARSGA